MKRSLVLSIAIFVGCVGSDPSSVNSNMPGTTATNVWHSSWSGGSANAGFSDPTGLSSGYIQLWENGAPLMGGASLWYNYSSVDPTSRVCYTYWFPWGSYDYCFYTRYSYEYGWGSIPTSDVRITPAVVGVNTTVSSGATFYAIHCDIDYNNWWNNVCYNVSGGQIDIRWTKHNNWSSFNSGTTQYDYGTYSYKIEGISWSSSALATGSLLGHSFTNAGGQISDSRTNTLSMTIVRGGGGGNSDGGVGMGGMGGGGMGGMGGSMADASAGGSTGSDGGDPMADGGM